MNKTIILILSINFFLQLSTVYSQTRVLIVYDELKQMEVLSNFLTKNDENIEVRLEDQNKLKSDFLNFDAVILYIHRQLFETTEKKIIEFTENGGRFICLHHSISSGKAKNNNYFPFLGIQLDGTNKANDPELPGAGYAYVEPVTLTIVNLNPKHYITGNKIKWGNSVTYSSSDFPNVESNFQSISFPDSEVYLNHKFTDGREKTVLMGLKFFDKRNNQLFMQDKAAWYKKTGKGEIFYFMPGHSSLDFENPNYSQMILNAINFK